MNIAPERMDMADATIYDALVDRFGYPKEAHAYRQEWPGLDCSGAKYKHMRENWSGNNVSRQVVVGTFLRACSVRAYDLGADEASISHRQSVPNHVDNPIPGARIILYELYRNENTKKPYYGFEISHAYVASPPVVISEPFCLALPEGVDGAEILVKVSEHSDLWERRRMMVELMYGSSARSVA